MLSSSLLLGAHKPCPKKIRFFDKSEIASPIPVRHIIARNKMLVTFTRTLPVYAIDGGILVSIAAILHTPFSWYIHYNSTLSTHQLYINTNHTSKVCTSTLPYTELISM